MKEKFQVKNSCQAPIAKHQRLRDVTWCVLVGMIRHFGGICGLNLQDRNNNPDYGAIGSSETLVRIFQNGSCHIL